MSESGRSANSGRFNRLFIAGFAFLIYIPILLSKRGLTIADTKSYLYLDPSRLLSRAVSIWDPHLGLGTTSHQNIGYLFPMGPFYWFTERVLHLPPWVAQRLWLASLIFLAGMGIRYLLRTLGLEGPGIPIAMLVYSLTPYALQYSSRLSVLLSPWAALPWLLGMTIRGISKPSWKYPALIAITVQLAGGVNASALFFALLGPVLYVLYAAFVLKEAPLRSVISFSWRTILLTSLTSLWWVSGLLIEGKYGLNVLKYTETIKDVSSTQYPYEILRGVGYWMFYGRDPTSFWNSASLLVAKHPIVVLVSLLVPATALLAATTVRWRYRLFFIGLILTGVVIGVAAAPFDNPSIAGSVFKLFAGKSSLGLALRSTTRATPLIALGMAVLLCAGVNAWSAYLRSQNRIGVMRWGIAILALLCIANGTGLWSGNYYSSYLGYSKIPEYWRQALSTADAESDDTRVLSMPGADFAAYKWGNTIDPIEPGLIDRPFVTRELVPWGSGPGANLVSAFDFRVKNNNMEPAAIGTVASVMNVGSLIVRLDMETARYPMVKPKLLWETINSAVGEGLSAPQEFGSIKKSNRRQSAGISTKAPMPSVALVGVSDSVPIVHTHSAKSPILLSGDAEGLIDLASVGLLDLRRPIFYAASFNDPAKVAPTIPTDSIIVLTDSNRRRAERGAFGYRYGYTEAPNEKPATADIHDQRLEVFPTASDSSQTVTLFDGIKAIYASSYGSSFGYNAVDRPSAAIDGNPFTAWKPEPNDVSPRLTLEFDGKITARRIDLKPIIDDNKFMNSIEMRFDDGSPITRELLDPNKFPNGQEVFFFKRSFSKLEIRITGVEKRKISDASYSGDGRGFSEINIPVEDDGATSPRAVETIRLPSDSLTALGSKSITHPLIVSFTRERTMDSFGMRRTFRLPKSRVFSINGTSKISQWTTYGAIDDTLGIPNAEQGGITVKNDSIALDPLHRPSSSFDGDLSTSWRSSYIPNEPPKIHLELSKSTTISSIDLSAQVTKGHAIPSQIKVTSGSESRLINLRSPGPSADGSEVLSSNFAPLTGTNFKILFTKISNPVKRLQIPSALEINELGLSGIIRQPDPVLLPEVCRPNLIRVNGEAFPVLIRGKVTDALSGRPLRIQPCIGGTSVLLAAGSPLFETPDAIVNGSDSNIFAVSQLIIASDNSGRAVDPYELLGPLSPTDLGPKVNSKRNGPTSLTVKAAPSSESSWLVLGENINAGWHASIGGKDLGPSTLIDGFANGWLLPASVTPTTIDLEWTPQKAVNWALWTSAFFGLLCLLIIAFSRLRGTRWVIQGHQPNESFYRINAGSTALSKRFRVVSISALSLSAGIFSRPWIGVLVGLMAYAANRYPVMRKILKIGPALIVSGVGIGMATLIVVKNLTPGISWPSQFQFAAYPVWIALFMVLIDGVMSMPDDLNSVTPVHIAATTLPDKPCDP